MRIVKNIDFPSNESIQRSDRPADSPLRFLMHVGWTETHEERILWLQYENLKIAEEYLSARLLYKIAKARCQEKDQRSTSLRRYKITKTALEVWEEAGQVRENCKDALLNDGYENVYKYHVAGRDEEDEDNVLLKI